MKANRKFIEADDNAVSAVIGVILMVAITVAIAATVYVYVSGMIGTSPETTPSMQFVKDATNKKLTVASADPGNLDWNTFSITWTAGNLSINGGTAIAQTSSPLTPSSAIVVAGDILDYDEACTVTIRHVPTNTLIGTWDFN